MYEIDKSDRMGLSQDDEKRLGFLSGDEDEDDAGSVVVINSDIDSLISKGGMTGPVGYSYTGKLAFLFFDLCQSSTPQFYQQGVR